LQWDVWKNTIELLRIHWLESSFEYWQQLWEQYKIKYPVAVCIAKSDTSLGREMKTKNNIGNVWNNDRGDRVEYGHLYHWIEAIYQTLNNRYIGNNNTIWELSQWGRSNMWIDWCATRGVYCYATSKDNRNVNMINCLSMLYNQKIDEHFDFKKLMKKLFQVFANSVFFWLCFWFISIVFVRVMFWFWRLFWLCEYNPMVRNFTLWVASMVSTFMFILIFLSNIRKD